MLGEEFGHLGLDRLSQQGARSVAQHLGKRVGERPWLKQLDDVSIGHGVSLLCWRSGGRNTPTIRRLLPVRPSPTFAHSSTVLTETPGTIKVSCGGGYRCNQRTGRMTVALGDKVSNASCRAIQKPSWHKPIH